MNTQYSLGPSLIFIYFCYPRTLTILKVKYNQKQQLWPYGKKRRSEERTQQSMQILKTQCKFIKIEANE